MDEMNHIKERLIKVETRSEDHIKQCSINNADIWKEMDQIKRDYKGEVEKIEKSMDKIKDRIDAMGWKFSLTAFTFIGALVLFILELITGSIGFR